MASTADTTQQLLQLLASLPAGTNPYTAINSYLTSQFFPDVSRGEAIGQLAFLATALGLYVLSPSYLSLSTTTS
jgi:hypothetical protein